MIRVWFNHWFSTAFHIINLMRDDKDSNFYMIGSNQRKYAVIRNACDEWYEEPVLDSEEYLEYCLEFCREHGIDVFVPRRGLVEISRNRERFELMGVKVLVDSYEYVSILNDKVKTYDLFSQSNIIKVPGYYEAATAEEFISCYEKLSREYPQVCMKFVQDEGGMSFRVIDNTCAVSLEALSRYVTNRVSVEDVVEALKKAESFPSIMLMPYMPGEEVSVDCLNTARGLIAIPRIKSAGRDERVDFDQQLISICREILRIMPLECPCNIQFRYLDGVPYLLEVNTRMSGGVQMGCLAAGINIPNLAVNKLLGIQKEWTMDTEAKRISYVEFPQLIRE